MCDQEGPYAGLEKSLPFNIDEMNGMAQDLDGRAEQAALLLAGFETVVMDMRDNHDADFSQQWTAVTCFAAKAFDHAQLIEVFGYVVTQLTREREIATKGVPG